MRNGPLHRWFQARPLAGDSLLALIVFGLSGLAFLAPEIKPTDPLIWLWLFLGSLPVAIRRVWLWWSLALTIALLFASMLDPLAWLSGTWAILVIAYTIAAALPFRNAIAATAALWGVATLTIVMARPEQLAQSPAFVVLMFNYVLAVTCFGIGRVVHGKRVKVSELEDRARIAEENQVAKVVEAINDERRRIARELHDVVAHHLSVMNVMATGARRTLTSDPDRADEALATIESTGRTTLREMRRLLEVLRTDDEPAVDDRELTPQPGLDAIHTLVGQVRSAGLPVKLVIDGTPFPLDQGIALTAFRIIQEGLTNTLKHGGPANSGVRISYREDELEIEVTDNGAGQKSLTTASGRVGHGLVGMRERVALYGGSLRTGPRPGGGFRVHALIPIEAPTETT
ncbi:histidine kinase [Stackebrandtia nassauensis DSM 44728]|uniref:histidine kinase n=2 Tax=Stackebrandtia TaxID=283810 RepID=D3Q574_STANL|nr:histidine kinase [Stackebrandtia nassauensis DSM 44728]